MAGKFHHIMGNERGAAAFTYVFMLVFLLAAAVPVILTLVSNSALSVKAYRNEKLAERIAIGGMESVFAYLRAYSDDSGISRGAYLMSYPGAIERTFQTPENVPVRYKATIEEEAADRYVVTILAEAGQGSVKRAKTIRYLIAPTSPMEWNLIDPTGSTQVVVPPGGGGLYIEGQYPDNGTTINGTLTNPHTLNGLSDAIRAAIDYYKGIVHQAVDAFDTDSGYNAYNEWMDMYLPMATEAGLNGCQLYVNCTYDSIMNYWAANHPDPPVLRFTINSFNGAVNVTYGSPSNPVVLIMDNGPMFNSNMTMTVYGTVIFPKGVTVNAQEFALTVYGNIASGGTVLLNHNNKATVTTHQLNGEGGHFYVIDGNLTINRNATLNIAGDLHLWGKGEPDKRGNLFMQNETTLNIGGDLYVHEEWTVNKKGNATVGGELYVRGNLNVQDELTLNVTGDIHVLKKLTVNKRFNLETSGNFHVLGELTLNNEGNLGIAGNLYTGRILMNRPSRVKVGGKIVVDNDLTFKNTAIEFEAGLDILTGSLYTDAYNKLVAGRDIFVEKDITWKNRLELHAGGNVGVGGNLVKGTGEPFYVYAGGGTTTLILPEDPDGGSPGGPPAGVGGSWNPVRLQ